MGWRFPKGSARQQVFNVADDDRLTDVSGSRWVAANAASRDVTLRIVEGGTGHEIYNSAQGDALIDEAIAWISARA